ncbi:hypothetical protein DIPPA_26452 [Diplonema papillatum]|nr:hypothetical protein DIPPA_26452 [Diplonema papillatum]
MLDFLRATLVPFLFTEKYGWHHGTTTPIVAFGAPAMIAAAFFLERVAFAHWNPKLTASARLAGETPETLKRYAAMIAVGGAVTALLGFPFLFISSYFSARFDEASPMNFLYDESFEDEEATRVFHTGMGLAEMFLAYVLYTIFMWCIGWDKGIDTILHHIAFLIISCNVVTTAAFVKLDCYAIAMEASTPFLMMYRLSRQLEGDSFRKIETWAGLAFCSSFLLLRPIIFCYQYVRTVLTFYLHPEVLPDDVSRASVYTILIGYALGCVLQGIWSQTIIKKLVKTVRTILRSPAAVHREAKKLT